MGRRKKSSFQSVSDRQSVPGVATDALYSFKVDYVAVGNKLRAQRKRLGYTQEQVAEAIGITPAFMGHIERGERGMALDTLLPLCNVYHITMDYLWSDTLPPDARLRTRTGRTCTRTDCCHARFAAQSNHNSRR